MLATGAVGGGEAVVPSGEAAYMGGFAAGQRQFAILFRTRPKPRETLQFEGVGRAIRSGSGSLAAENHPAHAIRSGHFDIRSGIAVTL
jgi:hypothetical protein